MSRTNGLALDAPSETGGGAHPQMARANGKPQQLWHFQPVGEAGEAGHIRVASEVSGFALDAGQGTGSNYCPEFWPWNGSAWQIWSVTPSPDGRAQWFDELPRMAGTVPELRRKAIELVLQQAKLLAGEAAGGTR